MKVTFEQAMQRLEEISAELSENEVSIDESLKLYTEGVKLVQFCSEKLKAVQLKVEEIDNKLKEE